MTDVNKCGSCTACCRIYHIPEFDKPAGKWCEHCVVGKSCKIYATRPERCVDFECMWLQSQRRPTVAQELELRPDKSKVVFAPSTNPKIMTALTTPGYPLAWQSKRVMGVIDALNKAGVAVAVGAPLARTQTLFKPDGTRKVVEMTEPDEDGMQWSINQ